LKIAIKIVSFPNKNGDFHSYVNVYQRVYIGNAGTLTWKTLDLQNRGPPVGDKKGSKKAVSGVSLTGA